MTIAPTPLIHVIDDDESIRKAVTRLLKAAGYEVQSYTTSGEFLLADQDNRVGCIILDIRMPGPTGLELQAALKRQGNSLPIIFLTGHGDIPMSVRAMKAGAVDFLTKPVQKQELLAAVSQALEIQRQALTQQNRTQRIQENYDLLTERERTIFEMILRGKLNKQIASTLGIAERTVKAHRAQLMEKMQVDSLAELVRSASFLGIDTDVS
jgi:FixJ family two-component response regulator